MRPKSSKNIAEQIAALEKMSDNDIDYSDIPSINTAPERFKNPQIGKLFRPVKVQKTLRIDADVLAEFESIGKGYQTMINTVLRDAAIPSIGILEELRERVREENYKAASELVSAYISLVPESRSYVKARARAIVINEILKHDQLSDYTSLVIAISEHPSWYLALEEEITEPNTFPTVVREATEKIKNFLKPKKLSHA